MLTEHGRAIGRRLFGGLLFAAVLALVLILFGGSARADECEDDHDDPESTCFAVYMPGMCGYLEPYSYWWYFWDCGNREAESFVSESVTVEPISDRYQRVTIRRTFTNKPDQVLERITPRRRSR